MVRLFKTYYFLVDAPPSFPRAIIVISKTSFNIESLETNCFIPIPCVSEPGVTYCNSSCNTNTLLNITTWPWPEP